MPEVLKSQVRYQAQDVRGGEASVYEHLSNQLKGFTDRLNQRLDVQAKDEGFRAGRAAGAEVEAIDMPDGSTISGAAFREGANMSHLAAVKVDINQNLARIQLESNGDPDVFLNKVNGYQSGLLQGTSEEVRPLAFQEIGFAASRIQKAMRAKVAADDRATQGAIVETGLEAIEVEALNFAETGDQEGVVKALTQYQDMLLKSEEAGLLPAGTTVERANKLQKSMMKNVFMGSFQRELEAGRGVEFMADFHKNKDFTPTEREELAAKMISRMNNRHKVATEQTRIEKLEREKRYQETERSVTLDALTGELTPETLKRHLEADTIDPGLARSLDKVANAQGVMTDDLAVKLDYSINLLEVEERDIVEDERLTRDTRIALVSQRRELVEDTGNWRRTQNGSEATRRIKAEFGMVDGLIAQLDPEKAKRAGRALTTLYETVETLPIENRATAAVDIADKIIKDLKKGDSVQELAQVNASIGKLEYQTLDDLQKAEEAGDIGGHAAKVLRKRLDSLTRRQQKLESEI